MDVDRRLFGTNRRPCRCYGAAVRSLRQHFSWMRHGGAICRISLQQVFGASPWTSGEVAKKGRAAVLARPSCEGAVLLSLALSTYLCVLLVCLPFGATHLLLQQYLFCSGSAFSCSSAQSTSHLHTFQSHLLSPFQISLILTHTPTLTQPHFPIMLYNFALIALAAVCKFCSGAPLSAAAQNNSPLPSSHIAASVSAAAIEPRAPALDVAGAADVRRVATPETLSLSRTDALPHAHRTTLTWLAEPRPVSRSVLSFLPQPVAFPY